MGTTPIAAAASNGHEPIAMLLAEYGADPNTRNYEGIAAIDYGSFDAALYNQEVDAAMDYYSEDR